MPKSLVLSFCYQIELYLPGNALFIRLSRNFLSLCNPFWQFFCKSVWRFTIFPKPLPESDSHMHHTHAPSENENFPSAKQPARTSFLSFFPSHFRSSFRHFCHVLCDFYFSFQVPKPPVFAAFSLLQGILLLILFFLFLRQKNLISGYINLQRVYSMLQGLLKKVEQLYSWQNVEKVEVHLISSVG